MSTIAEQAVSEPPGPPALQPSEPSDALAREAALIGAAMQHVETSPDQALEEIGRHLSEFPHGQMARDRECIAVDALIRLNRRDEARTRLRALVDSDPTNRCIPRLERRLNEN